jgi:hypothetical protein
MYQSTPMSFPKEIKDRIIAAIPETLIKEREGGGKKKLSYLSGSTIIDMLNKAFNYSWNWEVEREWIEESTPYFNRFAKEKTESFNGNDGAWEAQQPVAHVRGRLTVFIQNDDGSVRSIIKSGYGSKSVLGKQNDQESVFKAAGTDALKKAASLLGIGLELYRDEDEQIYFNEMNYEDPWTDELMEKFAIEREYITSVMDTYELDNDAIGTYVSEFSEGALSTIYDIVPDNIVEFNAYLKSKIAAAQKAKEEPATEPKKPLLRKK